VDVVLYPRDFCDCQLFFRPLQQQCRGLLLAKFFATSLPNQHWQTNAIDSGVLGVVG